MPEATVDAWTVAALVARDRKLRFACPTPAQQSLRQPWDILVEWPTKRFMIESKGLRTDGRIDIPADQLHRLVDLEKAGASIFYGLPAADFKDLDGRSLVQFRFQPAFETWHRILRPSAVQRLVAGATTLTSQELRTQPKTSAPDLRTFLRQLRACEWVERTRPGERPSSVERFQELSSSQIGEQAARNDRRPPPRQLFTVAALMRVA